MELEDKSSKKNTELSLIVDGRSRVNLADRDDEARARAEGFRRVVAASKDPRNRDSEGNLRTPELADSDVRVRRDASEDPSNPLEGQSRDIATGYNVVIRAAALLTSSIYEMPRGVGVRTLNHP